MKNENSNKQNVDFSEEVIKKIIRESLEKVVVESEYSSFTESEEKIEIIYQDTKTLEKKTRNIHEQALSHRLTVYLENSNKFKGYIVDCEYNRRGADRKTIDNKGFRPDIIVHERGNNNKNLLYIECKQPYSDDICNEEKRNCLLEKLENIKDKYRYCFLYLVIFPQKNEQINEKNIICIEKGLLYNF